jgi:hypothetical protein
MSKSRSHARLFFVSLVALLSFGLGYGASSASADARVLSPRVSRLAEGLRQVVAKLEAGHVNPNEAFEEIAKLEKVVGPPDVTLPPRQDVCTQDSECALTDLSTQASAADVCCPSLRMTAGTVSWVKQLETTCKSYEPMRGARPILLPGCGVWSGPVSATQALCRAGRCVPCLQTNDGSPAICH